VNEEELCCLGEENEEGGEDYPCKKCGEADHPEWILLCDKCDSGWHASCLRPPLMIIPEGDWFCPPCHHLILVARLKETLRTFEKVIIYTIEGRNKQKGFGWNKFSHTKLNID
jgi:remodeling and spacing factor 1